MYSSFDRCDCVHRTTSRRRRCNHVGGNTVDQTRHERRDISRTFLTLVVMVLAVTSPTTTMATIILNTGIASTSPPPLAPFPAAACPSVCFCDETNYVNCVGDDSLWEVPADLPRTVARLELRNYAIGTLAVQGALQELLDLHEVKLQQTKIASIENGTFGNLTRLLRLDLSQNLLERITSAMFEGLTSLRYLDLSTNRVADMDEAFVDLVNLEQLNLRDNRLPQLTVKSFPGLYKIQYLNLDSNRIASVEVGTFQYLTGLAHLIVSNNPLTALSRLDFFGSRLQYIDVSRVGLQRVPQSLTRYVRDLRLAKNNLTHVRLGDFDSYPYISLLVLDDNRIEEIEGDALGRQEYLVRLWLNGNRLQRVPANLPPGLRVLYAEENLLRALPAMSFQGLFNLEQLFLQRNLIERIDACAFCDLLSLRHLNLQANLLETVPEGAFANLSSLVSLDLSQNPIRTLPAGCFVGLDALRTLQLSRIKTFGRLEEGAFAPLKRLETLEVYDSPALAAQLVNSTRALQGLRGLRELNLMHNNLASLRPDFPHFFPQLKVVKLNGNPWNCAGGRDVRWMAAWINRTEIHFFHSYDIRCSQPAALLYRPLMMLRDSDFDRLARPATNITATNDSVLATQATTTTALPATTTITTASITITTVKSTTGVPLTTTKTKLNNEKGPLIDYTQLKNATSTVNATYTPIDNTTDTSSPTPTDGDPEVTHNNSSSSRFNITASGLDFDMANLESEYDEVDLLVEVTPSPTPAALLTSAEPETTAAMTSPSVPDVTPSITDDGDAVNATTSATLPTTPGPPVTASTSSAASANDSAVVPPTTTPESLTQSETTVMAADVLATPDGPRELNASLVVTLPTSNPLPDAPRVLTANSTTTLSVGHSAGDDGATLAVFSVAAGVGLLALGLTLSLLLLRWRRKYWPVGAASATASGSSYSFCSLASGSEGGLSGLINRHMRRSSSSISYSPQRDEVSIVTVSEGTVGLRTLTHQGLSNKLYFVLENGTDPAAINKEALPDASLQELLPSSAWSPGGDNGAGDPLLCPLYAQNSHHPPHKRKLPARRSSSTYCFTT